ncbi:MAG: O-sialoglycoprotein endopeptidase [Parcubacteria group bacterium Gr01-1014_46]|nr:MAG: O-sialoglycoprotein endopeptidase [Parcubacteria group bacterium Gr01-1014_46]
MKILSIETSCDETAVSIVEATGGLESPTFSVLGNAIFSQIKTHTQYGGVFPMMAKREHAKNLPKLLKVVLEQTKEFISYDISYDMNKWQEIEDILKREDGLFEELKKTIEKIKKPDIDLIAVTSGPGLEPALWVGISFAVALGKLWDLPVVPANHMEGHIASILINEDKTPVEFPALALLISGGHTEIVEIENWGSYKILGSTVDDAVGEAFDKVARLLGLPYPGGPEISKLAERARLEDVSKIAKFPRPMIHSKNLNFSFSGLKTAVLYYIRDNFEGKTENISENEKADIAREFEDSVVEVLVHKVETVLESNNIRTLIVAGGVIANKKIREAFAELANKFEGLTLKTPTKELSTDNSIMIACATYIKTLVFPELISKNNKIIAEGNLKLKYEML